MCPIRGAPYSVLSTCVPLLPYGSDPHPLIIKGHLSLLSSLSLGMMPDTCHFCHAQELPSAQRLLGSPELEHSQNLFLYGGCRSGRPEWNSHVSFPSGPTGWRVGKKYWRFTSGCCLWPRRHLPIHPGLSQGWAEQLLSAVLARAYLCLILSPPKADMLVSCVCPYSLHIYGHVCAHCVTFHCVCHLPHLLALPPPSATSLWSKGLEENKLDPFKVPSPHLVFQDFVFADLDKTH